MTWQPIDTAPSDEYVIVWCKDSEIPMLAEKSRGKWFYENGFSDFRPTHWQPLPEPPCEQLS